MWHKLSGTDGGIDKLVAEIRQIADDVHESAADIEHTKYVILAAMTIFAGQMLMAGIAACTGIGALIAGPGEAVAIAATRVTIQVAIRQLIEKLTMKMVLSAAAKGAAMGLLQSGGVDLGATLIQLADGDRNHFNLKDAEALGLNSLSGTVGGLTGGVLGGLGGEITHGLAPGATRAALGLGIDTAAGLTGGIAGQASTLPFGGKMDLDASLLTSPAAGGLNQVHGNLGLGGDTHAAKPGEAPDVPSDSNAPGGTQAAPAATTQASDHPAPSNDSSAGDTGSPHGHQPPPADTGAPGSQHNPPTDTGSPGDQHNPPSDTGSPDHTAPTGDQPPAATAPAGEQHALAGDVSPGDTGSPSEHQPPPADTGSPGNHQAPADTGSPDAHQTPADTAPPANPQTPADVSSPSDHQQPTGDTPANQPESPNNNSNAPAAPAAHEPPAPDGTPAQPGAPAATPSPGSSLDLPPIDNSVHPAPHDTDPGSTTTASDHAAPAAPMSSAPAMSPTEAGPRPTTDHTTNSYGSLNLPPLERPSGIPGRTPTGTEPQRGTPNRPNDSQHPTPQPAPARRPTDNSRPAPQPAPAGRTTDTGHPTTQPVPPSRPTDNRAPRPEIPRGPLDLARPGPHTAGPGRPTTPTEPNHPSPPQHPSEPPTTGHRPDGPPHPEHPEHPQDGEHPQDTDHPNDAPPEPFDPAQIHADHAEQTPAGTSYHRNDPHMGDLPQRVHPLETHHTLDVHITEDGHALIDGKKYTPEQFGDLARLSGWDGNKPIRLIGCGAATNGFAPRLATHLGTDVLAPTKTAWTDTDGNVYSSTPEPDHTGQPLPRIPPDGDWTTSHPDGTQSQSHDHQRPTGHLDPDDAKSRGLPADDWSKLNDDVQDQPAPPGRPTDTGHPAPPGHPTDTSNLAPRPEIPGGPSDPARPGPPSGRPTTPTEPNHPAPPEHPSEPPTTGHRPDGPPHPESPEHPNHPEHPQDGEHPRDSEPPNDTQPEPFDPAQIHADHAEQTPASTSYHRNNPHTGDLPHQVRPLDPRETPRDPGATPPPEHSRPSIPDPEPTRTGNYPPLPEHAAAAADPATHAPHAQEVRDAARLRTGSRDALTSGSPARELTRADIERIERIEGLRDDLSRPGADLTATKAKLRAELEDAGLLREGKDVPRNDGPAMQRRALMTEAGLDVGAVADDIGLRRSPPARTDNEGLPLRGQHADPAAVPRRDVTFGEVDAIVPDKLIHALEKFGVSREVAVQYIVDNHNDRSRQRYLPDLEGLARQYGIPHGDVLVIDQYTTKLYYEELNRRLRTGDEADSVAELQRAVNDSLSKLPPSAVPELYRSLSLKPRVLADFLATYAKDAVVPWKAFSSVAGEVGGTWWGQPGENVLLKIRGGVAYDISDFADGLHYKDPPNPGRELLLPAGKVVRVVSVTPHVLPDGTAGHVIELQVVGSAGPTSTATP